MTPPNNWITPIGGRRFVESMFIVALCFILAAMGKMSDAVFGGIVVAIYTTYVGGNTYQKKQEIQHNEDHPN